MNGTAIPRRTFFYRVPLARRIKNHIPQGWMIPQYRTLKSKLPKYRLKKAQNRDTVSLHVLKESHMTGDEVPVGRE